MTRPRSSLTAKSAAVTPAASDNATPAPAETSTPIDTEGTSMVLRKRKAVHSPSPSISKVSKKKVKNLVLEKGDTHIYCPDRYTDP